MSTRRFIPIDDVFEAIEDRFQERLPYSTTEGNPFGSGHHACPIEDCDVWRLTQSAVDTHVANEHGLITAADVDRFNTDRRRHKAEERRRERDRAYQRRKYVGRRVKELLEPPVESEEAAG